MKQWEMSEVFTFPTYLGNVIDASSVQVVPNWQQEEKEDSIVIKGVYVIKGHVQFDFVPREDEQEQTGIYIEHLDVEKDQAYFEYALPFSIDVPNEEVEKVTIRAINPQFDTKAQNHCTCSWNVCCDVEKRKAIVEEQLIKPTQPIQPKRPIPSMQEEKLVQETIEQPKVTIKQPQEAIEQPKVTIKQPQEAIEQPKATIKQPQEAIEQPKATIKQPQEAIEQPKATIKQPQEAIEQPKATIKQPKEPIEQPKATIEQPQEAIEYIKSIIAEPSQIPSEEVDFLEQLAEAYSVVQVQLNASRK